MKQSSKRIKKVYLTKEYSGLLAEKHCEKIKHLTIFLRAQHNVLFQTGKISHTLFEDSKMHPQFCPQFFVKIFYVQNYF